MNISEKYSAVLFELNKDQRGNAFGPDEFNLGVQVINIDYFKTKFGLPEEYRPGMPLPGQAWEVTHKISEDMMLFKEHLGSDVAPLYIDSMGFAILPSDYIHLSTVFTNFGDVEVLNDDDYSGRLFAVLKKPTVKNAVCRILNGKLEFAPKELSSAKFTYLRMPKAPFFDYNVVDDEPVYLPEGGTHDGSVLPIGTASRTVQFEWPEQTHSDIINLLVQYGSKNLRDRASYQWSERRKDKGE